MFAAPAAAQLLARAIGLDDDAVRELNGAGACGAATDG